MWKKYRIAGQATDDNITRRKCIACWIPKATDMHSEYVILAAYPLQQWLHECASILRYTYITCLVHSKNSARYCHKCPLVSMQNSRYSCHVLTKLEFSRYIFEKCSNIKLYEKSVQCESRCFMRTDEQTDVKLIFAFHNFAAAPKNRITAVRALKFCSKSE
jgi:hypothetical protein